MNGAYGAPHWYGAGGGMVNAGGAGSIALPLQEKGVFVRGQRRRMNVVPLVLCLFAPWITFCCVFGALSFSMHYKEPALCWTIVTLAAVATMFAGFHAWEHLYRKGRDAERSPSWLVFLFLSMLLALLLGHAGGMENYVVNTQKYYDIKNLGTYSDVHPDQMRGQQLMDAGIITFSQGSHVEVRRSMGFRNVDLYCVAPITNGNSSTTLATYDFWAVGKGCCSGYKADFHCTGFNDPHARGALRLMTDEDRPFYRLAVQQAEATYDIKAAHPLFFRWVSDAEVEVGAWKEAANRVFMAGIFSHLLLQAFLVAAAAVGFSKLGYF